jgi:hypothetical protein
MEKNIKRIIMAKKVAQQWLQARAKSEYRFSVYDTGKIKKIINILRSFRDKKIKIKGVPQIPDLGIKVSFDSLELWSSDAENLSLLKDWFEKRGLETSGIFR